MPETIASRPLPKRPDTGLLAWQATIGYISSQYSLDAMLMMQAYPVEDGIGWAASATWGQNGEHVRDCASLIAALRELWREVDRNHVIFEQREALLKRPVNYADHEWFDAETLEILDRVVGVTRTVYGSDWQLVLVYQPVEKPDSRSQARLLALGNNVQLGGRGATMRDSCGDLYRNAAPYYVAHSGRSLEDLQG